MRQRALGSAQGRGLHGEVCGCCLRTPGAGRVRGWGCPSAPGAKRGTSGGEPSTPTLPWICSLKGEVGPAGPVLARSGR